MGTSSPLLIWREADYEPAAFLARVRDILETALKLTGAAAANLDIYLPELLPFAESVATGDKGMGALASELEIKNLGANLYFRAALAVDDQDHLSSTQLQGNGVEAIFVAFLEFDGHRLGRLVVLSRNALDPTISRKTLELLSAIILQAIIAFRAQWLAEREQLRRQELSHRTSNTLGNIASRLSETLERETSLPGELATFLGKAVAQLRSLCLVSNLVTRHQGVPPLTSVVGETLEAALTMLAVADKVTVHFIGENAFITIRQAQALAAVLSELVTNTVKHGGAGLKNICVDWTITENRIVLDYADDGRGLPTDFIPESVGPEHQGLGLIASFLAEIRGTFELLNPEPSETGFRARIIFPYHPSWS